MENSEVARVFYEIADFLELQGVAFKPQAYRRAAAAIDGLDRDIAEFVEEGSLRSIPGIGEAISEKITELVKTGKLGYLDRLRSETPPGLMQLLEIPDVGPKKAMILFKELGIKGIDDLKSAIAEHKLQNIKGFGAKTEERILQGIKVVESRGGRTLLGLAYESGSSIVSYLKGQDRNIEISLAGSLRRMKETIGDIDILVATDRPVETMNTFVSMPNVREVVAKGETKSSIRLNTGVQVDLRVVSPDVWGSALQYFTGSKEHNIELRKLAISKGMKISEYGLFERSTNKPLATRSEEEIYKLLGLQMIPPEMREDRGEIELALKGELPAIIEYDELMGDLHCHTDWSDASGTINDVWEKAKRMGYEYIAITDHSNSLKIAGGLSDEELIEQSKEIGRLRESLGSPWVLAGSEVDILSDGKLDYPDKVLDELDFAIASVHSRFRMSEKEMTDRILSAISNEHVRIFAHPTGRMIGQRESYKFDFDRVIEAAKNNKVALEINSFPDRLDLSDIDVRRAIGLGAKISIDSDAHDPSQLEYVRYGIATARRGWARKDDVINALPLDRLRKLWGMS